MFVCFQAKYGYWRQLTFCCTLACWSVSCWPPDSSSCCNAALLMYIGSTFSELDNTCPTSTFWNISLPKVPSQFTRSTAIQREADSKSQNIFLTKLFVFHVNLKVDQLIYPSVKDVQNMFNFCYTRVIITGYNLD